MPCLDLARRVTIQFWRGPKFSLCANKALPTHSQLMESQCELTFQFIPALAAPVSGEVNERSQTSINHKGVLHPPGV